MGLQLQTVLSACIVNFALMYVQPEILHQVGLSQATGQNGIRENFKNLFNSIVKNNTKRSEVYRETLKQEIAREQQAFDDMKDEIHLTQYRNSYRKRNFYKTINDGENFAAVKRETNEDKSGKTPEQIEIESFALQVQNEINNMNNSYDRSTAENIHTMWHDKILEVEKNLRTDTAPVLKNEIVGEDTQVELFSQRVRRKIDNWPDCEHPVGFKIHKMWYAKAKDIEKNLLKKYKKV